MIDTADARVVAIIEAIHKGDIAALRRVLADHPELAALRSEPRDPAA